MRPSSSPTRVRPELVLCLVSSAVHQRSPQVSLSALRLSDGAVVSFPV